MKSKPTISLLFSLVLLLMTNPTQSKIEPPNYNFSLDRLAVFYPKSPVEKMSELHGEPEVYLTEGSRKILRFSIKHERYNFPVFVEVENNISVSFFTSLPTYFLHDLFHQSLINRYGPQQKFTHLEGKSVYQWTLPEMKLIYAGTCTITCFPLYFAVSSESEKLIKKIKQ